jgi:hypothetical protein
MKELILARFSQWQRLSWIVGGIGCVAWLIGLFVARHTAFQSYWFAWLFWSGLGFGALSILMTRALTGGAWSRAAAPWMHAASLTLPIMIVLMVPVFLSMGDVFPWASAHGLDATSPHKRAYLTVPWFIVRSIVYFAILCTFAGVLRVRAASPNEEASRSAGAGGIVAQAVCMLFASTDWFMSLEPRWYSTMLVVIVMAQQFLAALALSIIVVAGLARAGVPVTTKQLHDLGNLLLAFVIFWTYVSFGQFLIIWSGNLPREISWYLPRSAGGWQYVVIALAVLQFALPFFLLLSRARKQHARRLLPIAVLVLAASIIDVFWLVVPSFRPTGFRVQWLDVVAFLGIGGLWLGTFLGLSKKGVSTLEFTTKEAAHA